MPLVRDAFPEETPPGYFPRFVVVFPRVARQARALNVADRIPRRAEHLLLPGREVCCALAYLECNLSHLLRERVKAARQTGYFNCEHFNRENRKFFSQSATDSTILHIQSSQGFLLFRVTINLAEYTYTAKENTSFQFKKNINRPSRDRVSQRLHLSLR